jgi:hypothetical protein
MYIIISNTRYPIGQRQRGEQSVIYIIISNGGMYIIIFNGGMYNIISNGGMYIIISNGGMYIIISIGCILSSPIDRTESNNIIISNTRHPIP